ncbi:MAG: hypothetical protein U1G07_10445 [Verrucomicrobiota bacterium]
MKAIPSFAAAAALVLSVLSTNAQVTVTWAGRITSGLGEADGTELAVGDLVRVGTFTLTETQIQQQQNDLSALAAGFVEFGSAAIGDGFNIPSHWTKTSNGSTLSLGINTDRIYFWAFNAPSIGAATQQGIFTSTVSDWVFPTDGDVIASRDIDLQQVDHIVVGAFGTGTSSATLSPLYNLAPVPEPASAATFFALVCAGGVFLVRRCRQ